MNAVSSAFSRIVDELAALAEPHLARRRRRPAITLVERGGAYKIYRNGRRGPALVAGGEGVKLGGGQLPREVRAQPVEVRLDAGRMFHKLLQLPAASRNYLDAVIKHQLERTTPWSADRVVYDYALIGDAEIGQEQIAVRLVATSKDYFDESMDRLAKLGIRAALVGTSDDPLESPSAIDLLQSSRAQRGAALRQRIAAALITLAVLGAAASAWTGWRLHRLSGEATAIAEGIGAARAAIEAARAQTAVSEGHARLLALKNAAAPAVLLLDELSRTIPTTTYLAQLAVQGEELRIAGFSGDAAALIGILEAADRIADVGFAAPTVSGEAGTPDRFEITARVVTPEAASQ